MQAIGGVFSTKFQQRAQAPFPTDLSQTSSQRVLFHAASMGELEQLVPIIERLRLLHPEVSIIVSVFSASAIQHAHTLRCVNLAFFLPLDSYNTMLRFLSCISPAIVVIDRYDVWPNFIKVCYEKSIPTFLVNATAPSNKYVNFQLLIKNTYQLLYSITAVSEKHANLLQNITGKPITWLPDTRIDRVIDVAKKGTNQIQDLQNNAITTLLLGSSWEHEEKMFAEILNHIDLQELRVFIIPHQPGQEAENRVKKLFPSYTLIEHSTNLTTGIILVNKLGILLPLYSIGNAAFVGGGYGAGVHSVIEAAGYGMPIACGPNINRSVDAQELTQAGICTVVHTNEGLLRWIQTIVLDKQQNMKISTKAAFWVQEQQGSAQKYAETIASKLSAQL